MTTPAWREIQRKNFTCLHKLASFLQLDESKISHLDFKTAFPLNLPLRLAEKIEKNSLNDPIFLQFVPLKRTSEKFTELDPTREATFLKSDRLMQKYPTRSLLITTGACAMHCRYCFRQHFEYPFTTGFEKELALIEKDKSLDEIILSGGDPLSLSNEKLSALVKGIERCDHIKRLRIHTRFVIGIPERIDDQFCQMLSTTRLQTFFVIHTNHAKELDEDIFTALRRLQRLAVTLLNQSVLLKGVNDTVDALRGLCQKLSNNGIIPYYLHALDKVAGADHFDVPTEIGCALIENLTEELSGYMVPKFVREIPHKMSKVQLNIVD